MEETDLQTGASKEFPGYPELVLRETPDGRVRGVAMREMRSSYHVRFAGEFVEPEDVDRGIELLRRLAQNDSYGTWKKEADVDAATLDEAIASTPESSVGQKFVLVYRENEWLWGIWNNPEHPTRVPSLAGLRLSSVADFHGTRVSAAKRNARPGLDAVRTRQTLTGVYDVLEGAVCLLEASRLRSSDKQDYEAHPAVSALCEWWNKHAPEGSREAAFARMYVWNETDRIFNACDPEEPAVQAHQAATWTSFALFEHSGMPTVLATFFRGRRFNQGDDHGFATIFTADGSEGTSIGLDVAEVDEAYYGLVGLERLAGMRAFAA